METIKIKGKDYVTVNERIKEFWKRYPNGRILTDIITLKEDKVFIKAQIFTDRQDTIPASTGLAFESETSSTINRTSFVENR